jgi:hypothetical protein
MNRIASYIRRHHVGLLACVLALSGTAYAANKIGPKQIEKGAVHTRHIHNGNVTGLDLSSMRIVRKTFSVNDPPAATEVFCPRGYRVISGGGAAPTALDASQPGRGGWFVRATVDGAQTEQGSAFALCISKKPGKPRIFP